MLVAVFASKVIATSLAAPAFVFENMLVVDPFKFCELVMLVLNVCNPVNVCAVSVRAIVAEVVGNVIVVESVPAKVSVFDAVSVLLAASVSVPVPVVIVFPLTDVGVIAPRLNVVPPLLIVTPMPLVPTYEPK